MGMLDLVKDKVKDDSGRLTEAADYYPAIEAAMARYARSKPREIVEDLPGNGTHDLTLPSAWVDEVSKVLQVEYPVDEVPEMLIEADRWQIYRKPAGPVLRLMDETPPATASVRVTITAPRLDVEIVPGDEDAVASLAASFCCETLANLFAQTSDPTIAADAVNYRSKSGEFSRRAKRLADLYYEHLGVDPDEPKAAACAIASAPDTSRGRLTHERWR